MTTEEIEEEIQENLNCLEWHLKLILAISMEIIALEDTRHINRIIDLCRTGK